MNELLRLVRTAGNAGAVANAYRACEERKLVEARLEVRLVEVSRRAGLDRTRQSAAGGSGA